MLLNNFTPFGQLRFQSGGAVASFGTDRLKLHGRLYENASFTGQKSSIPQGYTEAYKATVPALVTSGRVAARIKGDSSLSGPIVGAGVLDATLSGDSTIGADAYLALVGYGTLQADSTFTSEIIGVGKMSARIDAGAQPSAFDIAQEVMGTVVRSGFDLRQIIWLVSAMAGGRTDVIDLGGGNKTMKFRGLDDASWVITADMAGEERTTVTLDLD
jgi:hypothetical protein